MDNLQYLPKFSGLRLKAVQFLRSKYYAPYCLRLSKNKNLLEVGCGPGYFLRMARELDYFDNISACDIEPGLVEFVSGQNLNVDVRVADAENLPNFKRQFGLICSFQVVEHLQSPQELFRKVNKILDDDGVFVFTTPNPDSVAANLMGSHWQGWREDHLNVLSQQKWQELLTDCGFLSVKYGSTFFNGLPFVGRGPLALPFYCLQLIFGWMPWSFGESHVFIVKKN